MNGNRRKTILLVEDEYIVAVNGQAQLEQHGHKVITANSSEKAVVAFKNGHAMVQVGEVGMRCDS